MTNRQPRVPFNPQPIEELNRRYPAAVRDTYDVREIIEGRCIPPSANARHVFDTEEGLRLIISVEPLPPDFRSYIHMSASFNRPRCLPKTKSLKGADEVEQWILETFKQISGTSRQLEFLGVSDGGIPHWVMERGH